jgi:hypothetical protein
VSIRIDAEWIETADGGRVTVSRTGNPEVLGVEVKPCNGGAVRTFALAKHDAPAIAAMLLRAAEVK